MKRVIINIWSVINYPLLSIAAQFVLAVIYSIAVGIAVGIQNAGEITAMSQSEINELVASKINQQIPLILSALLV